MDKMKPFFSVICVTYGRTSHLNAALHGFLEQQYDAPHELIIYNTCPEQRLKGYSDHVRIFNCATRPSSLGVARNAAIEFASGSHIVILDDDDYFLPSYLATLAKYWASDLDWIVFDRQFLSTGDAITDITPATANAVCFTKNAWSKIGGYEAKTVGEDTQFIGKLSVHCKGKKISLPPSEIGFIYGWGQGTYHISGLGEDGPGKEPAFVRAENELKTRFASGAEPTGDVGLHPHSPHNWEAQAKLFIEKTSTRKANAICVVELGRFGDIINILPILKLIHDNYEKPHLMVSREFASLLDGVSYVEPYIVDFPNHELSRALEIAHKNFKFVLCAQIWGRNFAQSRNTDAYNKESWRNCGMLKHFNNPAMFPLFDQRDPERESSISNYATVGHDKPFIMVQVTNSISSPFPQGQQILEEIRQSFQNRFHIVDVADIRCDRIYDLLGFMDNAACLVACDTALLHLAAASDIPVVALVNPIPWQGSVLRYNCVARITYAEATHNPLSVLGAITSAVTHSYPSQTDSPPRQAPARSVFHVYDQRMYPNSRGVDERTFNAQTSWGKLYLNSGVIPVPYITKLRTADKTIGDPRSLPYFKDVLKNGMDQAQDEDIIFWTNDDNWLHPDLVDMLRCHVSIYDVCTSRRCEVKSLLPTGATPEEWNKASDGHMGRDLFAAKKSWLVKHWDKIPDAIIGASSFDLILAYIVREHHGITLLDASSLDMDCWPAELHRGLVAHEAHANHWSRPDNYDSPSEKHNRKLYESYVAAMKERCGL